MSDTQEILINQASDLTEDAAKLSEEASQVNNPELAETASTLSEKILSLTETLINSAMSIPEANTVTEAAIAASPLVNMLTVFLLACFVGYYVVWKVTPALHTPLMSVTNAVSSIVIIGGMIAASAESTIASSLGLIAVAIASINIFGGFVVTQRMLHMFKKKV